MQTMGVSPAAKAATVFWLTPVSVSPNRRAALGVADDHVLGAGLTHHLRAHLAGEGALALPVADPAPR